MKTKSLQFCDWCEKLMLPQEEDMRYNCCKECRKAGQEQAFKLGYKKACHDDDRLAKRRF